MAYKYRCPYCGEKGMWFLERCGMWVSQRSYTQKYYGRFHCDECRRAPELYYGRCGLWATLLMDLFLPAALICVGAYRVIGVSKGILVLFAVGFPLYLAANGILHLLFTHFDKKRKAERQADARLTFTVAGKHPFVKKWGIYLMRFPERGTNAHSPVLYAMVCGKRSKKGERTYTLRVIRADNMDLPDLGEPAWLITNAQKVVEGTITATTPKKEL